jgi:uncharacterized membrane protein
MFLCMAMMMWMMMSHGHGSHGSQTGEPHGPDGAEHILAERLARERSTPRSTSVA